MMAPVFPWLLALLAAILAVVSYLDDRRGLPAGLRISVHLVVAAVLGYDVGANADWGTIFMIAIVTTWSINLYNFMDGADGLAGGMAIFGFTCFAIAAGLSGNVGFAAINLSIAGAAAGFLFFNFPPARIFLGDAGSIPLGFLAAALGWSGLQSHIWPWWFPLLVFSPFVVDATVTLCRRAMAGQTLWKPHREHYYQRLVRMGWSHFDAAVAGYVLMAATGSTALLVLHADRHLQWAAIAIWIVLYAACMISIDRRWNKNQGLEIQ
jgi:UDP-N-acetylmuramyl pentapeptide phosphotransferase/UDP-N-acetylglucosamine-1-phosphate transferase